MNSAWQKFRQQFINLYPPLFGAGIHARTIDHRTVHVEMRLTAFNRNVMGVHFGGSLYAMCDPWFALILIRTLGTGYIVWDKAATIQFIRPGQGTVSATFHIPQEEIDKIRLEAGRNQKIEPAFDVDVLDASGQVVAKVKKVLYVRKK